MSYEHAANAIAAATQSGGASDFEAKKALVQRVAANNNNNNNNVNESGGAIYQQPQEFSSMPGLKPFECSEETNSPCGVRYFPLAKNNQERDASPKRYGDDSATRAAVFGGAAVVAASLLHDDSSSSNVYAGEGSHLVAAADDDDNVDVNGYVGGSASHPEAQCYDNAVATSIINNLFGAMRQTQHSSLPPANGYSALLEASKPMPMNGYTALANYEDGYASSSSSSSSANICLDDDVDAHSNDDEPVLGSPALHYLRPTPALDATALSAAAAHVLRSDVDRAGSPPSALFALLHKRAAQARSLDAPRLSSPSPSPPPSSRASRKRNVGQIDGDPMMALCTAKLDQVSLRDRCVDDGDEASSASSSSSVELDSVIDLDPLHTRKYRRQRWCDDDTGVVGDDDAALDRVGESFSTVQRRRDWTREFMAILDKPLAERGNLLQSLSDDFVREATRIGETVIRERNLPASRKSIRPLPNLGTAGGIKFKHNKIFFKYAIDSATGMYGGDMQASKAAGHELKGMTAYMSCGMVMGLSFGLMCLIDFRGYRLIAASELPISNDTLIYGSYDGGVTVRNSDETMNEMMARCAKVLNLKGHVCGLQPGHRALLHGPSDMEGHRGTDGRYFLLDLARVFPPETPDPGEKASFLYRLLRPELVARFDSPLSSDAFTVFGQDSAAEHNAEVRRATAMLCGEVVPRFAAALRAAAARSPSVSAARCQWLVDEAHRAGINVRHLGRVRELIMHAAGASDDAARTASRLILTELAARALKQILRSLMRCVRTDSEHAFTLLAIDFFNRVMPAAAERDNDDDDQEYDVSVRYWRTVVWPFMKRHLKVHDALHVAGADTPRFERRLCDRLDPRALFARCASLSGVEFDCDEPPLSSSSSWAPIACALADVRIVPRTRRMYAIARIEADGLVEHGRKLACTEARWQHLSLARAKYLDALRLKPDDYVVLANLGAVHGALGRTQAKRQKPRECDRLFERAYDNFATCMRIAPDDFRALTMWGNALFTHATVILKHSAAFVVASSQGRAHVNRLFAEARLRYERALAQRPSDATLLYNFGAQLLNRALLQHSSSSGKPLLAASLHDARIEAERLLRDAHSAFESAAAAPKVHGSLGDRIDPHINAGCCMVHLAKLQSARSANHRYLDAAERHFLVAERMQPGSAAYNIACVYALRSSREQALHWLRIARQHHTLPPIDFIKQDDDLSTLL
jgi:tetratricopeptide (TPR) repeat protein